MVGEAADGTELTGVLGAGEMGLGRAPGHSETSVCISSAHYGVSQTSLHCTCLLVKQPLSLCSLPLLECAGLFRLQAPTSGCFRATFSHLKT